MTLGIFSTKNMPNNRKMRIKAVTKQSRSLTILEATTMLLQVKLCSSFIFSFALRLLLKTCISFSQTVAKITLITLIFRMFLTHY
jgi:hypothetical protein